MRYQEAFARTIKRYGLDVLSEGFLFYSLVSDLVGSSINDLLLLDIYYALNRDVLILNEIRYKHLDDAKTYVKSLIIKTDRRYKVEQYIKSVEPLFIYLYPNEYQEYEAKASNNNVVVVKAPKKAQSRAPVIRKPQVINKPNVPNKAIKKPSNPKIPFTINTINVNATCEKFTIKYNSKGKCRLVDENGIIVNSGNQFLISQDTLNINVNNKREVYTLELPKQSIPLLNLTFNGRKLDIGDFSDETLTFKKINMNISKGYVNVISHCNAINAQFAKGYFSAFAKFHDINLNGSECEVTIYNYANTKCSYNIKVNKGNIELNFPNGKILPKINHLFRPVSCVNGNYTNAGHQVRLNLSTNDGKIKVK